MNAFLAQKELSLHYWARQLVKHVLWVILLILLKHRIVQHVQKENINLILDSLNASIAPLELIILIEQEMDVSLAHLAAILRLMDLLIAKYVKRDMNSKEKDRLLVKYVNQELTPPCLKLQSVSYVLLVNQQI